ncbi:MarR family transcriptional regulator [Streptomyces canus]|uniref:MarR family transcriptional regulator n=1 Tax=Streptomyces canus TaxID=58343 RepID=UPI0027D7A0EF|nr:MarR family transcriptional regulator [Streptomyces canus]
MRTGHTPLHGQPLLAAVGNIYRVASAVRRHLENSVLRGSDLTVSWTLQSRGLLSRAGHPTDGRLVLLRLADEGEELMRRVFQAFNGEEAFVTAGLSDTECHGPAEGPRQVVLQVEEHGERRRREPLGGSEPAPRCSGRRPEA